MYAHTHTHTHKHMKKERERKTESPSPRYVDMGAQIGSLRAMASSTELTV